MKPLLEDWSPPTRVPSSPFPLTPWRLGVHPQSHSPLCDPGVLSSCQPSASTSFCYYITRGMPRNTFTSLYTLMKWHVLYRRPFTLSALLFFLSPILQIRKTETWKMEKNMPLGREAGQGTKNQIHFSFLSPSLQGVFSSTSELQSFSTFVFQAINVHTQRKVNGRKQAPHDYHHMQLGTCPFRFYFVNIFILHSENHIHVYFCIFLPSFNITSINILT